jgi:hypothetical protein
MTEAVNYERLMSAADIKLANEMSRYAHERAEGKHVNEDIKLGMSLLCGRKIAMELAGTELPEGKAYTEHFYRWKEQFGYPLKKDWTAYYSACIYCADHFAETRVILDSFSNAERLKIGIHGLFKRTREFVAEQEGEPRKKRKDPANSPQKTIKDQQAVIAHLEEELAAAQAEDTFFILEADEMVTVLTDKLTIDKLRQLVQLLVDYLSKHDRPAAKPKRSKKTKPTDSATAEA